MGTLRLREIAQDAKAETGGVWCASPWGGEFLIGRAGNREYRRAVRKLVEGLRDRIGKRDPTAEEWQEVNLQAAARTVLLGWRDVEGVGGKPLTYSAVAAETLLKDEQFGDLAEWIMQRAADAAAYRVKARQDAEGN